MILHSLSEDNLFYLKENLKTFEPFYKEPTNEWIYNYIENPFDEYLLEVDDFTLENNDNQAYKTLQDVENTKRLYRAMKNLSPLQATDERLWSGLAHSDFWSFLNQRYEMSEKADLSKISNHFFLNSQKRGKRMALFSNQLARYWWVGNLVYDKNREDPFELLDYFKKGYAKKVISLFGRTFMANKAVARGLLSALIELEKPTMSAIEMDRILNEGTKYLSLLGGSSLLDYFSEEEIKNKVLSHFRN